MEMNRGFYSPATPFLCTGGESVGPGMDCLQFRQPPGPFHYLISEQAKSLLALQELQHEVGALLEFRDLVIETFPNLRHKLTNLPSATMTTSQHHHHHGVINQQQLSQSNIPVSIRTTSDWTPGIRVKKKIGSKDDGRVSKKCGEVTIQDSGFSTETSSKETHSAISTTAPTQSSSNDAGETDEAEDELWNLLDVIHRKGTRLRDEVEALQGAIRDQNRLDDHDADTEDFGRALFDIPSADDVRRLRRERDLLLDRLAEMEAEVLAGRVHTARLQEDLSTLIAARQDLEAQLKRAVNQRGQVNSRIHDLHRQFITTGGDGEERDTFGVVDDDDDDERLDDDSLNVDDHTDKVRSELDVVLGDKGVPKVKATDSKKIAAILKERDPLVLRKYLLTTTVQNQVLHEQLDSATKVEVGLASRLDKAREENDELRFQLEDKKIELEGTRARIRMLEQLQKSLNQITTNTAPQSPDIIPTLESDRQMPSRTEITTASMKAMSPLPSNLQMDHSSSTESAHDQAENAGRKNETHRRKPSKIPLKSYTAPKPPGNGGGKRSPAPRSRSGGESPARSYSAQSWRNRTDGNGAGSLSSAKTNTSLPKSRNGSLVTAKDSLSGKLRDSLPKTPSSTTNSTTPNRGTLRKSGRWTSSNNMKDGVVTHTPGITDKMNLDLATGNYQYSTDLDSNYADSLERFNDQNKSRQYRYRTTSALIWTTIGGSQSEFYDSIDSNLNSNRFDGRDGENLAECDSLERQISDVSDPK